MGPGSAAHRRRDAALRPVQESVVWCESLSTSSLRAQRLVRRSLGEGGSNPESLRGGSVHSFILRCEACDATASLAEPRRMNGRDAAGPSPFEALHATRCVAWFAPQGHAHGLVLATAFDQLQTRLRSLAAHLARALHHQPHPQMKEGARKTGCPTGTRGPLCEGCTKVEYFCWPLLPHAWRVLPDRQRKGLWCAS